MAGKLHDGAVDFEVIPGNQHFVIYFALKTFHLMADFQPVGVFTVRQFPADDEHFHSVLRGAGFTCAGGFIESAIPDYRLEEAGNRGPLEEVHAHLSAGGGSEGDTKSCG